MLDISWPHIFTVGKMPSDILFSGSSDRNCPASTARHGIDGAMPSIFVPRGDPEVM
jgi:hypothetical protein